jgi:hypothetical protein
MPTFYILMVLVGIYTVIWLFRWIYFFLYPLPSIMGVCFAAIAYPPYWAQVGPLPFGPRMLALARLVMPRIVSIVRYCRFFLKGHFRSVIEAAREGNGVTYRPRQPEQVGLIWPPAPTIGSPE